jgi:hypothetical protein
MWVRDEDRGGTLVIENAKKRAHVILEKPTKKPKTSTILLIQEHISKISEYASYLVSIDKI